MEPQIFRFAEMILRDRCSTLYDLALLFREMDWKITERIGTRPSALHATSPFLKEVSQNCFVFDVVKFEKLLRF